MKKLSIDEMKKVVGGVMAPPGCSGSCDWQWTDDKGKTYTVSVPNIRNFVIPVRAEGIVTSLYNFKKDTKPNQGF